LLLDGRERSDDGSLNISEAGGIFAAQSQGKHPFPSSMVVARPAQAEVVAGQPKLTDRDARHKIKSLL